METKSNNILVGAVTLLLLALLAGFVIWISRAGEGVRKEYDIFFHQSVNGLAKGSSVSFSGVPVGNILEIKLWEADPQFVRVRISIDDKVPVLQGTVATISGVGFTGVSEIQLDGAVKGAPAIGCPAEKPESICLAGRPIIPTKPGALGELLNNAPLLLERLSTLTERLTNMMSDKNQASIEKSLANFETLSGSLAAGVPDLRSGIVQIRESFRKAGETVDAISATSASANALLNDEGKPAIAEMRNTLVSANKSLAQLEATLNSTTPAVQTLTTQTIPEFNQLARDLRQLSGSLKSVTEKLDQEGAGSLINAPSLPDYEPDKHK